MAQGSGNSLSKRLGRLRRGFVGVCRKIWKVGVEDTTAELRRYRTRILNFRRERREQRKRSKRSLWRDLPRNLVGMPVFALQMLFLGIAFVPLLIVQSLRYFVVGVFRLIVSAPRTTWKWLKVRKAWELAAGGLVLAVAAGAGGFLVYKLRNRIRGDVWAQYRDHCQKFDFKSARAELAALKERQIDDPLVDARIAAWESGEGREDDPEIVLYLMFDHFYGGRIEAAAREAGKYVKRYPSHWHARCILAMEALKRQDSNEAALHLAKMAKTRESPGVDAVWARRAAEASARAGDAARRDECIEYVAGHYLRLMANAPADRIHPVQALLVLRTYQEALVHFKLREDLIGSWMGAQKICQTIAASSEITAAQLVELGRMQEQNLAAVGEFRRRGVKGFAAEGEAPAAAELIESNLEKVWAALLAKEPKNHFAYLGRARRQFRAGNTDAAVATVTEGLTVCAKADQPALSRAKSVYLRVAGKTAEDRKFLDESLAASPDDIQLLHLKVESALAENNLKLALETCRQAAGHKPTPYWARFIEAQICLQTGKPSEAAAALETVADDVRRDPNGLRAYVKALAASGRTADADVFLAKLLENEELKKKNSAWAAVLVGAAGLGDAGKSADAARWAERAVAADGENAPARLLLADSLRAQLDRAKEWDPVLLGKCLQQYEMILRRNPGSIVAANNLVWLQIKGAGDRNAVLRHSEILRKAAESPKALPEILDTVGALCNLTGEYAEARRLMERALSGPAPRASYYYNLAEALFGLKKPREAEAELRKIEILKLPMTTRETVEREALLAKIKAQG